MNEDLIDKIVSEVLSEFEQDIMTEGIDVDMRSVTMTDRHEKLVDTSASTIKEACKIISSAYTPKTIPVLTLFSPLYDENGDELQNQ